MGSEFEKKRRESYSRISSDVSDKLFMKIIDVIGPGKAYLDPNYTAAKMKK